MVALRGKEKGQGEVVKSIYSLKIEPRRFADTMDMGCERKKGITDDSKFVA